MLEVAKSQEMANFLANRPALGLYPPKNWDSLIERAFMSVAPAGLTNV